MYTLNDCKESRHFFDRLSFQECQSIVTYSLFFKIKKYRYRQKQDNPCTLKKKIKEEKTILKNLHTSLHIDIH